MTVPGLEGRRILITGAGGGLGSASVEALLTAGAHVLALDRRADRLEALGTHAGLKTIEADLADHTVLAARLARELENGPIHGLVNNAAIFPSKRFEEYSLDEFKAVQAVNVEATVVCVQALRPAMQAAGGGRIVNISSITQHGGWEKIYPYVASKTTLAGLARAWAREFGRDGITVNAIAPGAFKTDAEAIHDDLAAYERFVLAHQSLKRRGEPRDFANVLLFLLSDLSSFVTGQTINVDGGWVMS